MEMAHSQCYLLVFIIYRQKHVPVARTDGHVGGPCGRNHTNEHANRLASALARLCACPVTSPSGVDVNEKLNAVMADEAVSGVGIITCRIVTDAHPHHEIGLSQNRRAF